MNVPEVLAAEEQILVRTNELVEHFESIPPEQAIAELAGALARAEEAMRYWRNMLELNSRMRVGAREIVWGGA